MRTMPHALLCAVLMLAAGAADAQTAMRVRGTITAIDGNVVSVKSRDGKELKLALTDKTAVATAKAITLADLKPGDTVGVTSMRNADGRLTARAVHTISATVPEGHGPWDLLPDSLMTNARLVSAVKATGSHTLTVEYKDGAQTFIVPDGTPIVTTIAADRSALKVGEYVFFGGTVGADGTLTTGRIQVSKDGTRPPQ
ncbi:MAG: DUF5666 domain-containing protein [Burkholderiales bacterium]